MLSDSHMWRWPYQADMNLKGASSSSELLKGSYVGEAGEESYSSLPHSTELLAK